MGQLITIQGLDQVTTQLSQCASELPHAVNWALAHAADDIRDAARANVLNSQYNLSHDLWGIASHMSRKHVYTSEVGYFTTGDNWHIKFFERGAVRKTKGRIMGQHFLQNAGQSADALAVKKMNESIEFMLRKCNLN